MILVVDNYDSFTYNLVNIVGKTSDVIIKYPDDPEIFDLKIDGLIISPGPGHPLDTSYLLNIIEHYKHKPILGVCLGSQALTCYHGGDVIQGEKICHGKKDTMQIVNLISIKGFPMAIGAIYLPILFKIIQLQINLSHGLVDKVNASTFVKSNQTGIIISVICCIVITVLLFKPLGGFYNSLTGFLGLLITVSPVTMVIGAILLVLTAIGIIQAAKMKFNDVTITKG